MNSLNFIKHFWLRSIIATVLSFILVNQVYADVNGEYLVGLNITANGIEVKTGNLILDTAASKIVPGATSLSLRNNANTLDNLIILDSGATTFRSTVSGITTLTATTLGGTLSTAAQPNITSVGTLSSVATSGGVTVGNGVLGLSTSSAALTMNGQNAARYLGSGVLRFNPLGSGQQIQFNNFADTQNNLVILDAGGVTVPSGNLTAGGNVLIGGATGGTVLAALGTTNIADFQGTAATAGVKFTPSGQDQWFVGAGAINTNDFGINNNTRSTTPFNITGGASGGYATFSRSIGVNSPTGGDKGAGTINVASGIYLNGTAYTNPDYVLERWATGRIVRYADKPGASTYKPLTLPQMEMYARTNLALPGFGQKADNDLFSGSDQLLARVEDSYVYLFDHEYRLAVLEADNRDLKAQVRMLEARP